VHQVCRTSNLEIGWGCVRQVEMLGDDRSTLGSGLWVSERPVSIGETVLSQQAMRQAARRSALDAQAARRKERADRQRRLEQPEWCSSNGVCG
jgi:hypothetical protein